MVNRMSSGENTARRIVVLAPMPPEKSAYALARYSRSPDSIEESVKWVHEHSSEKFWEQFYFAYGHSSIADLGHITISLENISELAAIRVEDEPLWDGQAKSSRYQNFAVSGCYVPSTIAGTETEALYRGVLGSLFNLYRTFHDPLQQFLRRQTSKPDTTKQNEYDQTIAARTFDVTRYLLPLAAKTNVGQVVSIRTLEKQITRLLSAQLPELKAIGEELKEACAKPPSDVWATLCGNDKSSIEPLAPTLARHTNATAYHANVYRGLHRHAKNVLRKAGLDDPMAWEHRNEPVDLIEPHPLQDELVATLLYRMSHAPYRNILEAVRTWSRPEKEKTIQVACQHRGPYDELIKEFRCGYSLIFDVLMDIGGWRDLHRHRRCQQVQQHFTTAHGYETPTLLVDAGLARDYQVAMDAVKDDIERLRGMDQESSIYAMPFGFKVRCLFKMDYAEAEYISQLRSGVKGHWSYRTIAWLMKQKVTERDPYLGELIQATPPDIEDILQR